MKNRKRDGAAVNSRLLRRPIQRCFPIFLLLGVAPQSIGKCILTLGICVVLFVVMNLILLRKKIFKKKSK